ncbi:hypothetical protein [Bradyrhizobium sp. USDA 4545]|uniref:hypothetical protein n=1 Tax=Bradyrhizobium sp. USDA 4545 TaxID=2817705 RepID=UPI0020A5594C|nr:hypothetical protein [Bradyrhizobium sp. USDA 4545]MCP1832794.1 hypothetical protein [Bradyrhizobium sp. USDA 4545]
MIAAKILTAIALVFIALGLVCAVMVSRPREPRVGRRLHGSADPYRYPFGDMPGFSREQCEAIARRPVELHHEPDGELLRRSAAGSGAVSSRPLPLPANDVKRTQRQVAQEFSRQLFNAPAPKPPFGRGRRAF